MCDFVSRADANKSDIADAVCGDYRTFMSSCWRTEVQTAWSSVDDPACGSHPHESSIGESRDLFKNSLSDIDRQIRPAHFVP